MKIHAIFAFAFFLILNFTSWSQNCALTCGSTTQLSQNFNVCQYQTVLVFSANNSNSGVSITLNTNNGSMVLVTNPVNAQDASVPFTFNSNFNGAYIIKYNVPCDQTSIDFTFNYDGPDGGDCILTSDLINLSPMAVTLTNFYYKYQKEKVLLLWSTAFEKDNKGFKIEKSKDGLEYDQIAFVPSQINDVGSSYQTIVSKESSYYKLIQMDNDGIETILGIVFVNTFEDVQIIASQVSLTFMNLSEDSMVEIANVSGQIISRQNISKGINMIDINQLSQGVYYVKVVTNGMIKSSPFVKI